MGEHRNVGELVARVTNQSIEIERMRGELRSVKRERDHWIEVCADLRGQLAAGREGIIQKIVAVNLVSTAREPTKAEHVFHGGVIVDPYENERKPSHWSWWRRVFGGA